MQILFVFLFSLSVFASEQSEIYFNMATEKYLQGDYEKATEALEKAIEIEPNDPKLKSFFVKIVVEAGTNYNLSREYQRAMKFLEKGKKIAPENKKINELYNITKEVLTRQEPKKIESKKQQTKEEGIKTEQPIQKPVEKKIEKPPEKKDTIVPVVKQEPQVIVKPQAYIPVWVYIIIFVLVVGVILLSIQIVVFKYKLEIEKIKSCKIEKEIQNIKEEFEKEKKELEKKIEEEKSVRQIKENILLENSERMLRDYVVRSSKVATPDVYITSPNLEQIKNRIASTTQELYQQSPEVALTFLKDMIKNPESTVRENIVRALATISSPETLDMLIILNNDQSESVKREVIKEMKKLKEKADKSEVIIPNEYYKKISEVLVKEKLSGEWIF